MIQPLTPPAANCQATIANVDLLHYWRVQTRLSCLMGKGRIKKWDDSNLFGWYRLVALIVVRRNYSPFWSFNFHSATVNLITLGGSEPIELSQGLICPAVLFPRWVCPEKFVIFSSSVCCPWKLIVNLKIPLICRSQTWKCTFNGAQLSNSCIRLGNWLHSYVYFQIHPWTDETQ